jgi:hypothetical protein
MKHLFIGLCLALTTFFIGISIVASFLINQPLPSVELPQFPLECVSKSPEIIQSNWSHNQRAKFLQRFKEVPLNKQPASIDESYRLIWIPSFHNPTVIHIWRSEDSYFITTKQLNRKHNLEVGDLMFQQTRSLTKEQWQSFVNLINQSCFWNAPSIVEEATPEDGASWTLEGLRNGKYHFVDRVTPSEQMSEIFKELFRLTGIEMEYESYL